LGRGGSGGSEGVKERRREEEKGEMDGLEERILDFFGWKVIWFW
jgi:hypothetical protein